MTDQLQIAENIIKNEVLTIDDVVGMYGMFDEEVIKTIADSFYMNRFDMHYPQLYKRLATVIGVYIGTKHGKEKYFEFLEMYNKDVIKRFENKIKLLNALHTQIYGLGSFTRIFNDFSLTDNDLKLRDEYSLIFSIETRDEPIKQFAKERQMESILCDLFGFLNDTKVLRQVDLQYGKADIVLENQKEVCVVELKTGEVKRKDLYQVFDYALSYPECYERTVSKVLIGASFKEDVLRLAKELDITCVGYEFCEFIQSAGLFFGLDIIQESSCSELITELLVDYNECGCEYVDHPKFRSENIKESYLKQFKGFQKDKEMINNLIEKGAELYSSTVEKK